MHGLGALVVRLVVLSLGGLALVQVYHCGRGRNVAAPEVADR